MTALRLTPLAASLPSTVPFVGPETQERSLGRPFRARLGANESLFGPSPHAIAAMAKAATEVWMYGDPELFELKAALAAHHACRPDHIVVGEGIDGLLGYLTRLMIAPGDKVVTSLGAYPTFPFHVAGFGGEIIRVPYKGDHEDPEALVACARAHRPKLVYLANPDNPMGSHHAGPVIEAMVAALPPESLLILDEAYIDLAPPGTAPMIAPDDPRVIRFRTFSKGYGMAGLRVGYAICAPDLARAFDKIRNHFGMGRIAQAGALAALADQDWLAKVRAGVAEGRDRLAAIARANGATALPSATNFVTMDLGRDGDFARATLRELTGLGVFVRMPGVAPLDRCLRVSVGDKAALDIFEDCLPRALQAAR
ncbi:pyridoxal phosphate-dependent aminotransferase [Tabrizicola oligotrophica]|uniref:histidinol-phosphate transaminase n=1 Tax=Tabrizicola oligotrophica TaxID=2710650 RepID=A0A6M0QXY8_9RHOB|nr:pyridoxal phosphate-dependent aminotransferase [Tabrizicola oligotrophica]NEY91302.1 pyridoxal phosphate-dependent aminotransferase [Tabrizicola oligotrophica]